MLSLSEQKVNDFIRVQLQLPLECSLARFFSILYFYSKNRVGIFGSRRYSILVMHDTEFAIYNKTMLNVAFEDVSRKSQMENVSIIDTKLSFSVERKPENRRK